MLVPEGRDRIGLGIFERSMLVATAASSTTPKTNVLGEDVDAEKVILIRTIEMTKAPTRVRQMLPTPPVIVVPPTTTAAMEGRSMSAARVGEPLARRPARITPASAAKALESTQAMTFTLDA